MCKKKILKNYSIVKEKKMRDFNNKLKVFISSKTGNTPADEKYVLARVAAKDVFCKTFLHNIAKKKYTPLRLKFFSDYCGFDRAFLSR